MERYLKNKFSVTLFLIFTVFFLMECSNSEKKTDDKAKKTPSECATKPLNPNGDSELALLMRDMMASSQSLKEKIKQGNLPDKFP